MTLRVLVVDDSAVVRQMVNSMLGAQGMDVATASDPLIAMQKMAVRRPDVILLDIEMPRMDGLTFLRKVMREDPIPVVICSALAGPSSDVAFRALECGAVDVVAKPEIGLRDFLQESAVILGDVIRGAAYARLQPRQALASAPRLAAPRPHPRPAPSMSAGSSPSEPPPAAPRRCAASSPSFPATRPGRSSCSTCPESSPATSPSASTATPRSRCVKPRTATASQTDWP